MSAPLPDHRQVPAYVALVRIGAVVGMSTLAAFGIFLLILAFQLHSKKEAREYKAPSGAAARKA